MEVNAPSVANELERQLGDDLFARSVFERPRTLMDFAEQCIIIPESPVGRGLPFNRDTQPFVGILYRELDAHSWRRVFMLGPVQSGKTTTLLIPMMYWVVERKEKCVFGIPDMRIAADKWREDVLPILRAAGWESLLPETGGGSRGGIPDAWDFRGAGTLRLMSGGGGDAVRSSYTARGVFITEVDKLDITGATSREADKVTQFEARTAAWDDAALIIGESTVSNTMGRIWREYQDGTASRILCPCVHCGEYVDIEREHLAGWQDAESIIAARANAMWVCPACGVVITEAERVTMNRAGMLVHKGQTVVDGAIQGEPPAVDTLGFRWSAFNNLFWTAASIAGREWKAKHDPDIENSEKAMRQFVWALPYDPPQADMSKLAWGDIATRTSTCPRGYVPAGVQSLTFGIDLGRRLAYWVVLAFRAEGGPHVVDYGAAEVASDSIGEERALLTMLREQRDIVRAGWPHVETKAAIVPAYALVDSGWQADVAYAFMRESVDEPTRWHPSKGASGGRLGTRYSRPRRTNDSVRWIGEEYHLSWLATEQLNLVDFSPDHWKSYIHERLREPRDNTMAMTLFAVVNPKEHLGFARQLSAEQQTTEFIAGRGEVTYWENPTHKANHWLDALVLACVAGHMAGVRTVSEVVTVPEVKAPEPRLRRGVQRADGRSWLPT